MPILGGTGLKRTKPFIIGVYGPSGSGKSSFCKLLAKELGFKHYELDKLGHDVLSEEVEKVAHHFPSCVENGVVNREKLGSIVFSTKEKLELLNKITHSAIVKKVGEIIKAEKSIILLDGAVIHKTKIIDDVKLLVLVTCDRIVRVERLVNKREISRKKAEKLVDLFDGDKYDILIDTTLGLDIIKNDIVDIFKRYLEE